MSLLRPVGPEPASIYWLRRGAVVLAVLSLLVGGWWLLGRGSSAEAPVSAPSPSLSASASTASPSPIGPVKCLDEDIRVTADTDAASISVGAGTRLTMTVQNLGPNACLRDVGPKANEIEITSGGVHVWSSDDCNPSQKSDIVSLEPRAKAVVKVSWDGRRSQNGCPQGDKGKTAGAGRYEVVARNGDVMSEATPFAIKGS